MAKTAIDITDQDMVVYRATARQQAAQEAQECIRRAQRAWDVAPQAAQQLKTRFGATQVILFGSLARQDSFHRRSDIDLVVEGIKSQDFWRAWSALDELGTEFEIDLIDLETASSALRQEIEREGIKL